MTPYMAAIGLEVHVQLKTRSKMFCACPTTFGHEPNTRVCPVCLGYPGTLPVMNAEAIHLTVLTGLMLGARIATFSKFDRKHYFYPDMPKNYQISQYDRPLCEGGGLEVAVDGVFRKIGITRIHLEEDVGKNLHFAGASGVDFNRAGLPLMEIVTEPEITSADEAYAFLTALKQNLLYAGVSYCNLEEGNIRCDVNCSLRPADRARLGVKTEIKNMNTFKGVAQALRYEISRQRTLIESGGQVVQETRRWDLERGCTEVMRGKEDAHDYRYFPEPDLMPVTLTTEQIAAWARELPELPRARCERWISAFGLPEYDARVLAAAPDVAAYFDAVVAQGAAPKAASNWIMTEVLRSLAETEKPMSEWPISAASLAELIKLTENRTLNSNTAKDVFLVMRDQGGDPRRIVAEKGLSQVSDTAALDDWIAQAIAAAPRSVADYQRGKTAALQHLLGQVMRLSGGKADAARVRGMLIDQLAKS